MEALKLLAKNGYHYQGESHASSSLDLSSLSKKSFAIRQAFESDLSSLVHIEEESWKELRVSSEVLKHRLLSYPEGQWVATTLEDDNVVGVIYTQRLASHEVLLTSSFASQHVLHQRSGRVLQLLGVAVLPEYASLQISATLRDFVLRLAVLSKETDEVVAMTRCSGESADETAYRDRVSKEEDPTLQFHLSAGAKLNSVVRHYRPEDSTNYGHAVLIKYILNEESVTIVPDSTPRLSEEQLCTLINEVCGKNHLVGNSFLHTPLMDLGLDSLRIMEFRSRLSRLCTGITIQSTVVFDHPTPHRLLCYLNGKNSCSSHQQPTFIGRPSLGESSPEEGTYVLGVSCRFPGGANDPVSFFNMLREGTSMLQSVPASWEKIVAVRSAGFLEDGIAESFDASFFGIRPAEAVEMDPHQRLLLEVAYEALDEAQVLKDASTLKIGVFVGLCNNEWGLVQSKSKGIEDITAYSGICRSQAAAANRISFCLNLMGPSVVVDTACSSSLAALHTALLSLRAGDCEIAVVAAADLLLSPYSLKIREAAGMLSGCGANRSFARDSSGYVRSEGAAAIVLRRVHIDALDDIVESGVPLYGKILGSAMNQDGRSASFTAPNGTSQRDLLISALKNSRLSPSDVDYLETHGTGTALGDPVEWGAIKDVFLNSENVDRPLLLGAVKSNIGHLEGVAGLAGLIKVLLSFRYGCVPPNLHTESLNEAIDINNLKRTAVFPDRTLSLIHNKEAIAGVSSFGSGGTNVHICLQQVKSSTSALPVLMSSCSSTHINRSAAYLFSGQTDLRVEILIRLAKEDVFASILKQCADAAGLDFSLADTFKCKAITKEDENVRSHLFLLALQVFLGRFWLKQEVSPNILLGHSFGEYALAVHSGALSLEVAARLVSCRARLLTTLSSDEKGKMVAVRASEQDVLTAFDQHSVNRSMCSIAAINGPISCVISGEEKEVVKIVDALGCSHKQLSTQFAFHSPLISAAATAFREAARAIISFEKYGALNSEILFASCLTGSLESICILRDPDYWYRQMISPVRFYDIVECILRGTEKPIVFVELGMDTTLTGLVKQILTSHQEINFPHTCISTFDKKSNGDLKDVRRKFALLRHETRKRVALRYSPKLLSWRMTDWPVAALQHTSALLVDAESDRNVESVVLEIVREFVGQSQAGAFSLLTPVANWGIDSLAAISIRNNLVKKLGLPSLPPTIVLQCETLQELCVKLRVEMSSAKSEPVQGICASQLGSLENEETFDASSTQLSMMFHHVADPDLGSFIETFEWNVRGMLDVDIFHRCWRSVIESFPILRTVFNPFDLPIASQTPILSSAVDGLHQPKETSHWFHFVDLSKEHATTNFEDIFDQRMLAERRRFQKLDELPLLSVVVFKLPDANSDFSFHVLLTIHHLLVDGDSLSIILSALQHYYKHYAYHQGVELDLISGLSFASVILRERRARESKEASAYWQSLYEKKTSNKRTEFAVWKLDLPDTDVIREHHWVDHSSLLGLIECAKYCRVTLCSFIEGIFSIALNSVFSSRHFAFGITHNGRVDLDQTERIVGPCVNTFPVFIDISADTLLKDYIKELNSQILRSIDYSSLPLVDVLRAVGQKSNLFNLIFDYQTETWSLDLIDNVEMKFERLLDRVGCPLSVRVLLKQEELLITAVSESSLYNTVYVRKLIDTFASCLRFVASTILDSVGAFEALKVRSFEGFGYFMAESLEDYQFDRIFPVQDFNEPTKLLLSQFDFTLPGGLCDAFEDENLLYAVVLFIYGCAYLKFTSTQEILLHYRKYPEHRKTVKLPIHTDAHHCCHELVRVLSATTSDMKDLDAPVFCIGEQCVLDEKMPLHLHLLHDKNEGLFHFKLLHQSSIHVVVIERLIWHIKQSLEAYFSLGFHGLTKQILASYHYASHIPPYLPDRSFEELFLQDNLSIRRNFSSHVVLACDTDGNRVAISYRQMDNSVNLLAKKLVDLDHNVLRFTKEKAKVIAVVMEKGWEQVVAVLAILRLQCTYLPIDAKTWPEQRVRQVLEMSEAVAVLTQKRLLSPPVLSEQVEEKEAHERKIDKGEDMEKGESNWGWLQELSAKIPVIAIDDTLLSEACSEEARRVETSEFVEKVLGELPAASTEDLAYLIYTSGSTGLPKGVCCHHRGAMNTIQDLNDRFKVTEKDRVLGLSSLSFDLSVYDIFGMLHAGGTLVLPAASCLSPPDPAEWLELLVSEQVTVWNTVPAFMELLVSHVEMMGVRLPKCLRLIFMSGDWIPTSLPSRIRAVSENGSGLRIVSMGGATEASIWSNIFEIPGDVRDVSEDGDKEVSNVESPWNGIVHEGGVPRGWKSIPYGQPMRNQRMYILNHRMEHCEVWVTGSIYIGGVGVAAGYYKNPERTAYQFVTHPVTGEKLFRTGDLGRVRPEGWIEILGREDSQVKVNGYRVELGEIEKTLMLHEHVLSAVVALQRNVLCAYIVLRDGVGEGTYTLDYDDGSFPQPVPTEVVGFSEDVLFDELRALCLQFLTEYMVPHHFCVIDEVPLSPNGKVMRDKLRSISFEISRSRANSILACDEKEEIILSIWKLVLRNDVAEVDVNTNFFSAGGDSLKSIQVVSHAKAKGLIITVPQIFSNPTVRSLAEKAVYLADCGPAILGTSTEVVSTKPIFEIISKDEQLEYPMIGINQAHFVGLHTSSFSSKGLAPQIYFEWEFGVKQEQSDLNDDAIDRSGQLDVVKLEAAINRFVARHMTFRSVVTTNGTMKVLEPCPRFELTNVHYWSGNADDARKIASGYREYMLTVGPNVYTWPMFDIRVTQTSETTSLIHVVVSLFLMDAMSDLILRQELSALYREEVTGLACSTLPPVPRIQFKDYCFAMAEQLPLSQEYRRARQYWMNRLPTLSSGPELPMIPNMPSDHPEHQKKFINRHCWLTANEYKRAKRNCSHHSVTMPSVLLAAYALVLYQYSSKNEFLLNILLCLRHQVHEDVNKLVGNCSSTVLCNVDFGNVAGGLTFLNAVRTVSKELSQNLEHAAMSGVEVMQELNRQRGNTFQAVAPFIFTTPIGVEQGNQQVASRQWMFQERFFSERVPHTACVNAIKADPNGTACASMDIVDGQFPDEVIDGMFNLYSKLLNVICSKSPLDWCKPFSEIIPAAKPLPPYITDKPFPHIFMQQPLYEKTLPLTNLAVICSHDRKRITLDYRTLRTASATVSKHLYDRINSYLTKYIRKDKIIAVVMEKGWEQVVAVLAILRLQCTYLPIDAKTWPEQRVRQVLEMSEAVAVLTQKRLLSPPVLSEQVEEKEAHERKIDKGEDMEKGESNWGWLQELSAKIPVIAIDDTLLSEACSEEARRVETSEFVEKVLGELPAASTEDLAYLIYTSGSTGLPKGVCCHHRGAMNTIQDLNDRFKVTEKDRVLGLSSLSFDLSVYDIFGMLHAGGTLVLPAASCLSPPDPAEWLELLVSEQVTVWNTVPAFMELLVSHVEMMGVRLPKCLRLIFMSGDWIPTSLPSRIRAVSENGSGLRIVSMGGATEASIWSNIFEIPGDVRDVSEDGDKEVSNVESPWNGIVHEGGVPRGWKSIPYGQPMRNQRMYILNHRMEHCEVWVTGSIYIGGVGVAAGYYKNPERTAYQFVTHPVTGEKLFRTGDLGRVRPEGWIEILGREDSQVKVNGYRVELGEIEKTLMLHEHVLSAVVAVKNNTLCAYILAVDDSARSPLLFSELRGLCKQGLTDYMIPRHWNFISDLPLSANGKVLRDLLPSPFTQVESNDSSCDEVKAIVPPTNDLEMNIRAIFGQLLSIPDDSICCERSTFFQLGGNSLTSIQLLFALRKKFGQTISVQDLFRSSTVKSVAQMLSSSNATVAEQNETRWDVLELTQEGRSNPPLILFNPAGASGLCYMTLADRLRERYNVYVLDDGVVQGHRPYSFSTIEEAASSALLSIKNTLQVHYGQMEKTWTVHLAGWSYGGVIAVEVAKQWPAIHWPSDVKALLHSITLFDAPLRGDVVTEEEREEENEAHQSNHNQEQVLNTAGHHFVSCTKLLRIYHHRPIEQKPLQCQIVDLRPEDSDRASLELNLKSIEELTTGHISQRSCPGDHWTMLNNEHIDRLVTILKELQDYSSLNSFLSSDI